MSNKLAILIPTIEGREHFLDRLLAILEPQIEKYIGDVEVITLKDNMECSIGAKRNMLMYLAKKCGATHRCYIDDDDTVTPDYLDLNMPGVYGDYDCNSLVGIYSLNGFVNPNKHIFIHSIKYDHYWENATQFFRNPNHLNVCKIELIKNIKFQEKNFGEDGCWSEDLFKADVLKKEYEITKPFYNYLDRTKFNGI